MTTTAVTHFMSAGDQQWRAQVRRLAAPGQPIHLRISSHMTSARDPHGERTQLELTLAEGEYRALLAILRSAESI